VGTVTQPDGTYNLSVPSDATTIVFSFVGMTSQEVAIEGRTSISVALESDAVDVDEVVVVAYGKAKKSAFTGSAAVIKADAIENRQVSNVSQALSGQVAGVQVRSSTGQPGTSAKIRIRGMGSISSSSEPLYVVDGVPFDGDISSISTQDIESMTVLKDAASNALYGARGANGVVMITTKKGKSGEARISFEAKFGVNQRGVDEYDIMTNPSMYYEKSYEGYYNNYIYEKNNTPAEAHQLANDFMLSDKGLIYNIYSYPEGQNLIGVDGKINPNATLGRKHGDDYYLINDDWYDEVFGANQSRQEYNLSVSGANDKMNYYMSFNYLDDAGIISNSGFKRLTTRLKADYQVRKWLKVNGNVSYANSESTYPGDQTGLSSKNLFYLTRIVAPIYPLYVRGADGNVIVDDEGHTLYDYGTKEYPGLDRPVMGIANPVSDLKLDKRSYKSDIFSLKGGADFQIIEGLSLNVNAALDLDLTGTLDKSNAYYGQSAEYGGSIYRRNRRSETLNIQQLLNYSKQFGNHSFTVLVGHETYDYRTRYLSGSKQMIYDKESEEISNGILKPSVYSGYSDYFVEGYLSRIQYDLKGKYFASASYRRDGSSKFAEGNKWGNFWSLGASWLLNKEVFLEGVDFINLLKLKASYGVQGNDNLYYSAAVTGENGGPVTNYYPYADQYDIKNANDKFALEQSYVGNKNITWETSYNLNVGTEFTLFNSRLSGSFEYFNRRVDGMLFYRKVPAHSGFIQYPDNIGEMENKGIDISLNGTIIRTNQIEWDLAINATHFKNEILSLPPEFPKEGYQTGTRIWKVGGSIYDQYVPVYMGVEETTGNSMWKTYDEETKEYGTTTDFSLANDNRFDIGTTLPDLQGGISTTVRGFGFDFSVSATYQIGGQVYDYAYRLLMHGGNNRNVGSNWHKDVLNSWSADNTNTDVPKVNYNDPYTNAFSDRWFTDASFFSINNITLGYTIPKSITDRAGLGSVRVYGVADNVALFSKRKGLDPRQSYSGTTDFVYSPIRTISGGVKVTF
ncbi:MAG: SusC/RagA family TonB-linked outer membrane protein, partial [Marinilabiliaceae bacterium]|nr:SusC/RagA family TonB-linked outer membrane protein [Marinilabiliaceae bacterium]